MKRRLRRILFAFRRCKHPPSEVVADVYEGDYAPCALRWCRICGSVQKHYESNHTRCGPWREPMNETGEDWA